MATTAPAAINLKTADCTERLSVQFQAGAMPAVDLFYAFSFDWVCAEQRAGCLLFRE